MTILEKKSLRKKKAIYYMVNSGEMSPQNGLLEAERLNDEGKLLDNDYEELAEYLESLLEREEPDPIEPTEEIIEDNQVED